MVLTDREIWLAISTGQIRVEPKPTEDILSSTALDLTLGNQIRTWKTGTPGVDAAVCPSTPGYNFNTFVKEATHLVTINEADGFTIKPKEFILAWTHERVELPYTSRIAARVEGKSSLARLGVGIHVTAPTIHAGFEGNIQLEVWNHGSWKVKLTPGMRICQLIFEQTTGTPNAGYRGQFQNQTGG